MPRLPVAESKRFARQVRRHLRRQGYDYPRREQTPGASGKPKRLRQPPPGAATPAVGTPEQEGHSSADPLCNCIYCR